MLCIRKRLHCACLSRGFFSNPFTMFLSPFLLPHSVFTLLPLFLLPSSRPPSAAALHGQPRGRAAAVHHHEVVLHLARIHPAVRQGPREHAADKRARASTSSARALIRGNRPALLACARLPARVRVDSRVPRGQRGAGRTRLCADANETTRAWRAQGWGARHGGGGCGGG